MDRLGGTNEHHLLLIAPTYSGIYNLILITFELTRLLKQQLVTAHGHPSRTYNGQLTCKMKNQNNLTKQNFLF